MLLSLSVSRFPWMALAFAAIGTLLILMNHSREGEWCLASAFTLATVSRAPGSSKKKDG